MNTENYTAYIESGTNITSNKKNGIISIVSTGFCILLGAIVGFTMDDFQKFIIILMIVVFLLSNIVYFIAHFMHRTVKILLIQQLMIYISFFFQMVLIQTLIFYDSFGLQWEMIWIYLPLPVPSLVFGFIHSYMLKYDKSFSSGKIVVGKAGIICVPIVFLGKCLVKAFMSKINQETGTLLFLIIFSIINLLLSLGLLNIQRLYYYSKQKRTDQSGDGSDQSGDGSMIDKQTET